MHSRFAVARNIGNSFQLVRYRSRRCYRTLSPMLEEAHGLESEI